MEHTLKCWPEHYAAIEGGRKTVELRLNDRPYAVGDALHLREFEPLEHSYTGQSLRVRVTHILNGGVWLSPGYIAMSIRLMGEDGRARIQEDFRQSYDRERARADGAERRLNETYEQWRHARNAELLLVQNDLEETRRTNRKLLEDQHNLLGRLHDVERECAAALQEAAEWKGLAERRRDELSGVLEELRYERRALCDLLSADPRTMAGMTLVEALRAVLNAPRVSSNTAPLGTCPRCGGALNNLSPGISVVAGGVSVCTSCLGAGEYEVARARSL